MLVFHVAVTVKFIVAHMSSHWVIEFLDNSYYVTSIFIPQKIIAEEHICQAKLMVKGGEYQSRKGQAAVDIMV